LILVLAPRLAVLFLVGVLLACAGPRSTATAAPISLRSSVSPPPSGELAAAPVPPASRRELVSRLLGQNVRVRVYDGDSPRRTASGVVLATEDASGGPVSYVVTNAHVVDTKGYDRPRFVVVTGDGDETEERAARVVARGELPAMDLSVLAVPGARFTPAELAPDEDLQLGDEVVVVAAPYGKALSVSGGMISQVEWDRSANYPRALKTDAPIGYGASGGGIYAAATGRLLAIVEGYRTAKVNFAIGDQPYTFDVPMPGETFGSPSGKVRKFLADHGLSRLLAR
jgi:S1-C subfamily serine protease